MHETHTKKHSTDCHYPNPTLVPTKISSLLYNIHLSILNHQYNQQICKLIGVNILLLHFWFVFLIKKKWSNPLNLFNEWAPLIQAIYLLVKREIYTTSVLRRTSLTNIYSTYVRKRRDPKDGRTKLLRKKISMSVPNKILFFFLLLFYTDNR